MQPSIVERAAGAVLGTLTRIEPTTASYDALWGEYMAFDHVVRPLSVDGAYYGVYYATGQEGRADFVAGMMVPQSTAAPSGLTLRPVGGGPYAAFACTMATIAPTWRDIYATWLPASGYVEDDARPCFERYPAEGEGPDVQVTIFLAVKPR